MKLKRVRIFGFKTFADKVEFDLDGDLIAIVGPNGCGKSNIVDAILWGLGEPNARNLRAGSATDVIFNGSENRKPVGFAEVTLLFDNDDRALPLDAAEVSVARRITRAGDSSFSINKKACRLKDIYDLLADSGLGRAGYAIVGQREIDQALSASAEERRAWIDEAAGVQRFRAKRVDAIRRLETAEDHLKRIDQIVSDLEFQREPLREEAEIARRFQSLQANLTELETNLLTREVLSAASTAAEIEASINDALKQATQEADRASEIQAKVGYVGENIAELERELDATRELRQSVLSMVDRCQGQVDLLKQKLTGLDELEASLTDEATHQDLRIAEALQAVEKTAQLLADAKVHYDTIQSSTNLSTAEQDGLNRALREIDAQIEASRKLEAEDLKQKAEAESALIRLRILKEELTGVKASRPDLEAGILEADGVVEVAKEQLENAESGLKRVEQLSTDSRKQEDSDAKEIRRWMAELASLEGRKRGIESTLEAHEGLSQGSAAVMALVKQGQLPDQYEPVAESLEIRPEHTTAIETALGGAAHDLIVPHDGLAKQAIQFLKDRHLGRATFQPLNLIRQGHQNQEIRRVAQSRGIIGIAADLVNCKPEHAPVVQSLLGRILVAETLDDALAVAGTSGWTRVVTLDGEVVHSAGAVSGGKTSRQTSGILHRKAELTIVEEQIEHLQTELFKAQKARQEREVQVASVVGGVEAIKSQVETARQGFNDAVRWRDKLQNELVSMNREQARIERDLATVNAKAVYQPIEIPNIELLFRDRDELFSKIAKISSDREAVVERLKDAELRLREAKDHHKRAEDVLARAEMSMDGRARRLSIIGSEREEIHQKVKKAQGEKVEAESQVEAIEKKLIHLQHSKAKLLEESYSLADAVKQAESASKGFSDRMHRLEVERARAESKRATALERLAEEYCLLEEELDQTVFERELPDDVQAIVSRLKREIRAMGPVNVGAIEAFERLTIRFNELDLQRGDVRSSIAEIQQAADELDRLTRDKFLETFELVREEFKVSFQSLFGGGEADLSLSDSNSILTAGVSVNVQVPGKRTQRLELLSGGERSMSAIAFLFALLRVKPSPLVVLDEVDAPLDGRNVERYVDILRSFKGTTQFLVITHNPVTIEAAPIWFGVTMRDPGITTVLQCKAPDQESVLMAVVPEAQYLPETNDLVTP
jgi:chromosome segregation protein